MQLKPNKNFERCDEVNYIFSYTLFRKFKIKGILTDAEARELDGYMVKPLNKYQTKVLADGKYLIPPQWCYIEGDKEIEKLIDASERARARFEMLSM